MVGTVTPNSRDVGVGVGGFGCVWVCGGVYLCNIINFYYLFVFYLCI